MSWLGWIAIGIMSFNAVLIGMLLAYFENERRRRK